MQEMQHQAYACLWEIKLLLNIKYADYQCLITLNMVKARDVRTIIVYFLFLTTYFSLFLHQI